MQRAPEWIIWHKADSLEVLAPDSRTICAKFPRQGLWPAREVGGAAEPPSPTHCSSSRKDYKSSQRVGLEPTLRRLVRRRLAARYS